MDSRIVSDHVTGGLLGIATYVMAGWLGASGPIAAVLALTLYAALVTAFHAYRRSLRGLQPQPSLISQSDDQPATVAPATAGPHRRRRHLHAA